MTLQNQQSIIATGAAVQVKMAENKPCAASISQNGGEVLVVCYKF